jgi:hypothetical protein
VDDAPLDQSSEDPSGDPDSAPDEAATDDALDAIILPPADTLDAELVSHRWYGIAAIAAFIGLVVCSNIGTVLSARWANRHPAGLLALSSRNRHLLLVVAKGISPFTYTVIATSRLMAAALVCHVLGRAYGPVALRWFIRFLGLTPGSLARFQNGFDLAQWVLIPIFVGSNIVCVLTGVHRTPLRRFVLLLLVGIAGRLALLWWLAKEFERQLNSVLNFLNRWQTPLIIFSAVFLVIINVRNFQRGRANRGRA